MKGMVPDMTVQRKIKVALIPAYQPDGMLIELLGRLSDVGFESVVVDDGSGDDYEKIFDTARHYAEVLTHAENRGKGRALKTGLIYIRDNYSDVSAVVTLDAGGQHNVEDAVRVLEDAAGNSGCLSLGIRGFDGKVPLRRRLGNTITQFVYHLSAGVWVSDTQTGLRAFSPDLIPFMIEVEGERHEYEMNVLLRCPRSGIPIREVPIKTVYFEKNKNRILIK